MSRYQPCKTSRIGTAPDKRRSLSLDAFIAQIYLPHVKARKRSWTLDERLARNHLSKPFGDKIISSISSEAVEEWFQTLLESGSAPATCNRILAVFKTICSYAETRGYIESGTSPCADVRPFKVPYQRERYLSQPEARNLMEALEKDSTLSAKAIQLLLLTGARKNEILKARWENVNIEQRILTVPLSKSGKARHLVLSDMALAVIKKLPKLNGNPWLFPGNIAGKPLVDLYDFWDKLRKELGLADVRIHDLRHTFASFLVNSGHSLYEVQKMLGHGDPRTTMRYAHLGHASLLAAAETVSGLLGKEETEVV